MGMTLRAILIVIGVLIVGAIIFDGWRRIQKSSKTGADKTGRRYPVQDDVAGDPLFGDTEHEQRIEPTLDESEAAAVKDLFAKQRGGIVTEEEYYGSVTDSSKNQDPAAVINHYRPASQNIPSRHTLQARDPDHTTVALEKKGGDSQLRETIVIFNVLSRNQPNFDGPNVLQALLSMGLKYGNMSIFHRHEYTTGKGPVEFSIASISEPGIFDLDAMGSFTTPGLCLFLRVPGPRNPLNALDLMLEAADKLALRLGGDVVDQDFAPLSAETVEALRTEIAEICRHNEAVWQQSRG